MKTTCAFQMQDHWCPMGLEICKWLQNAKLLLYYVLSVSCR